MKRSKTFEIALGDPAFFANGPDPAMADLRRHRPVSWRDKGAIRSVTTDSVGDQEPGHAPVPVTFPECSELQSIAT